MRNIILLSIIFVVLLGVGYLFFDTNNVSLPQFRDTEPVPSITLSPTPTPGGIEAEIEWVSLEDDILQYSVSYPNNWYTYPAETEEDESAIYSYDITNSPGRGGVDVNELKFAVVRLTKEQAEKQSFENIRSEEEVVVDSIPATRYIWEGLGSGITIVVPYNSYVYNISAYPSDSVKVPIFNEMIESFRFL